ncbi:MAG: hypothetical protein JWR52_1148 [Marmoricola sp.]|nr:hypothetical protein [Marmoricola sp.]
MTSVLIVVSAADSWTLKDGSKHPTGYWAEELVQPLQIFSAAGWAITVATPRGVAPTIDKASLGIFGGLPSKTRELAAYLASQGELLSKPKVLSDVKVTDFDVVFYPGGHGPMEDLAVDPDSGQLLSEALRSGMPVALLCHAPAAAFASHNPDGSWPFEGYRMTGLSNVEERLNGLVGKAEWLLEDRLIEMGARYVKGKVPLAPFMTVDRNLYTAQNPASSAKLARRLVADQVQPALNISVSRVIPASPEEVYNVISDVTSIGERSPETHGARWIKDGEKFLGKNRIGPLYRWSNVCTVTRAERGKVFEFKVAWPSKSTWTYELEAVKGGTKVTESIRKEDPQYAAIRTMQNMVGVRDRGTNLREGMRTTLDRLAESFGPDGRHASTNKRPASTDKAAV